MIRKILVTYLIVSLGVNCNAQSKSIIVPSFFDSLSYYNKYMDSICKNIYINKYTNINQDELEFVHIYILSKKYKDRLVEEDFIHSKYKTLLVSRRLHTDGVSFIDTDTHVKYKENLFSHSYGKMYKMTDDEFTKKFMELFKIKNKFEIKSLFYLTETNIALIFCELQDGLYVIDLEMVNIELIKIDDYINCCWDNVYRD